MNTNDTAIFIRNATIDDSEQLINLRKLLLNHGLGHYVAKTLEDELAWQKSYHQWLIKNLNINHKIQVIVSCYPSNPQKILGCAIAIVDERVPFNGCLNGLMGWIQTVVVDPQFRKKGIAEEMMSYLMNWFRNNDIKKVALQTTEIAKALYERLEFYDTGEPLLIKTL